MTQSAVRLTAVGRKYRQDTHEVLDERLPLPIVLMLLHLQRAETERHGQKPPSTGLAHAQVFGERMFDAVKSGIGNRA